MGFTPPADNGYAITHYRLVGVQRAAGGGEGETSKEQLFEVVQAMQSTVGEHVLTIDEQKHFIDEQKQFINKQDQTINELSKSAIEKKKD